MNRPLRSPHEVEATSQFWAADEPVIQGQYLENDHPIPLFGDGLQWDLRALGWNPNTGRQTHAINFKDFDGLWNLRARELAMAMLNPAHRTLRTTGIFRSKVPAHPKTVRMKIDALRNFVGWLTTTGRGGDLGSLKQHDFDAYLDRLNSSTSASTVRMCIAAARELYEYGPVITGGGLHIRPWGQATTLGVSGQKNKGDMTTPVIPPEVWWPLLRACWQYINVYSHDILAAGREWSEFQDQATSTRISGPEIEALLEQWLARPDGYIPLHRLTYGRFKRGDVHWTLLSLLATAGRTPNAFADNKKPHVVRRRQQVLQALDAGSTRQVFGGLTTPVSHVDRQDGSSGPWIEGLDPATVRAHLKILRNACYVFCAALSMMRDSELQSIRRGSVTTHYGATAIRSQLRKQRRGNPEHNWWIIEPVAQAIAVAEQLATAETVFGSSRRNHDAGTNRMRGFDQHDELGKFIGQLNGLGDAAGLEPIPDFHLAPHMFRRTMAIITAQQPDGEIALGLQLKHAARRAVANGTTGGYAGETAEWAQEFEHELQESVAAKLVGLWSGANRDKTVTLGAGAQGLKKRMDSVRDTYSSAPGELLAKIGDERLLRNLLRDKFSTFRWGSLNHCLGIADQALCLDGLPAETAAHGMMPNRCQPATCRNSVITDDHLPVWIAEEQDLMAKLRDRKMAIHNREQLESELATVQKITRKVAHGRGDE